MSWVHREDAGGGCKILLANDINSHLKCTIVISSLRAAMIVCVCRRISDRDIARHARAGMGFDEIQLELGVATQCGQCEGCARDVVAQCHGTSPTAHIKRQDQPINASDLAAA